MNTQNITTKFEHNLSLIRNATPMLELVDGPTVSSRGVMLTLDGINHMFDGTTAVYENTRMYGLDKVQDRFMNSTLFVGDNDELLDYRLGGYNGVIHSNETIESFIQHVGARLTRHHGMVMMASESEAVETDIAQHLLGIGGKNQLLVDFAWSPFMHNLRSLVQTIRVICSNGAMMRTPLLQNDIRVVNDWERHMGIARTVLLNRTEQLLTNRMEQMYHTVAPLSLVDQLRTHAEARLESDDNRGHSQQLMLRSLLDLTDVVKHGKGVITEDHTDNLETRFKDRCPSHMPLYSLFNLATEMNSHTAESESSSRRGVDSLVSRIMFNDEQIVIGRSKMSSAFKDPEAALAHHMAA